MHRTRWTTLLACFLLLAVLSGAGYDLSLRHHGWVPAVSLWGGAAVLVMTLVVLVAGRGVRRLRAHEPTWMTPTGAAMTALAAQSSSLGAAALGGLYVGALVCALVPRGTPAMTGLTWSAGGCVAACVLWLGTGLLVEHWCAIDESDDDTQDHGPHSLPPGSAAA